MDTDGVTARGEKWSAAGRRGGGLFMHQWPIRKGDGKRSVHIIRGLKTVREEEGDHGCGDRIKDQHVNGHSSLHIVNCRNTRMAGNERGEERTSGLFYVKRWLRTGCEEIAEKFPAGRGGYRFLGAGWSCGGECCTVRGFVCSSGR